jgi:hypothetical protein
LSSPYDGAILPVFSSDGKNMAYVANDNKKFFVVVNGEPGPQYDNILQGGPVVQDDGTTEYLAMKDKTIYRVKHAPKKEQ